MSISIFSNISLWVYCASNPTVAAITLTFSIVRTLLVLPLCVLVIFLAHRQWRRQRSFAPTSHSDVFASHIVLLEMLSLLATVLYWSSESLPELAHVSIYIAQMTLPGEMAFHTLTCVERYLAVVHPITYLGLRKSGGVQIRNISIGCVWLLCLGWTGVTVHHLPDLPFIPLICLLASFSLMITFCSLAVLCVLIRPKPGEVGGEREQVTQSKRRAFHTITATMAVLWFWCAGLLLALTLSLSPLLTYSDKCIVLVSGNWFALPSTLMLPLQLLHLLGKLTCCGK